MKKLLFLGGTVGNNKWRDSFTADLKKAGVDELSIFNPVVKDWNAQAQAAEEMAKKAATHLMFFLGSPQEEGNPVSGYSMVEATMSLYDKPDTTVVVFDESGIDGHPLKAYKQAQKVLKTRFPKANIFGSRDEALSWLIENLKD